MCDAPPETQQERTRHDCRSQDLPGLQDRATAITTTVGQGSNLLASETTLLEPRMRNYE